MNNEVRGSMPMAQIWSEYKDIYLSDNIRRGVAQSWHRDKNKGWNCRGCPATAFQLPGPQRLGAASEKNRGAEPMRGVQPLMLAGEAESMFQFCSCLGTTFR
jgi:hypothetical protein